MSAHPLLSARVAAEVRAEKARQKLSGRDLAQRAGFPTSTVARWLRDETLMNLDEASALAGALGLSLTELLQRANDTVVTSARDLPIRRRRSTADAGHPDLGGGVNARYLAAIIHGPERRSSRDDWRIRELRGSHDLPILLRQSGQHLRICRSVAA